MINMFTQDDIKQWAIFSGVQNAVHCDQQIAKTNGLPDIIAQGMLTLLASKRLLAERITASSWIKYHLKKPIFKNTAMHYFIDGDEDAGTLTVEASDGQRAIVGRFAPQRNPPKVKKACNEIRIDRGFINSQLALFRNIYPTINQAWIIMDAFLFSVCFKFQNGELFYQKPLKITKEPDKSKVVTFQVDQKIFISDTLLHSSIEEMDELSFYYEDQDVIKQDDSLYGTLNYQVFQKDELIYQSSLGSITRAFDALARSRNANV